MEVQHIRKLIIPRKMFRKIHLNSTENKIKDAL